MRLPRLRFVRPIAVTLALLSCTENGPVGPRLQETSARFNASGSSQSVVISQVYGGGGNAGAVYRNDFIEILNNGSDAVNVTGWSVQYASAAGTTWSSTTLSGTLQPGKFMLIREAAGTGGTTSLPTPDVNGSIPMAATAGKVALVRNTTLLSCGTAALPCNGASVADFVGYGNTTGNLATYFEGASAAPTLANTTSDSRGSSGCTDTGDNGADFTSGSPNPRNNAAAAVTCNGVVVPVDHITVAPVPPATGTVTVGATVQFKATVFDAANNDISSSNSVVWSTSPTGFATVDANGLATGTAAGSTSVVATSGGKSGNSPLTVTPAAPVDNGDVVISQIYGGGGNSGAQYTNDYIELLNKGDNAVNLAGWSVQYSSAGGASFQAHALSGTIQPGHYFLVQEASNNVAVGGAMPAADASDGLNLSGTTGKVILARTTTAQSTTCPAGSLIVDMVGYGTGTNCTGSTDWKGATGQLSNTTAAFRKGDGCTNSGNATNDFTVSAPTPRNSASPTKRCAVVTPPPAVHFSELHYDNSGTDVNEKIEIAGPAGTDLTGWSVVLYGGDATPAFSAYGTTDLGVTIPATCGSNGVIVIDYGLNGIKNAKFNGTGNPAGMALVDNNNQVVEFLSYEGSFTALDGPAAGQVSVDIGVAEEPAPAPGNSLHRDDLGVWQTVAPQDFGACNTVNATPPPASGTITFTGRLATDPPLPVGFEDQLFASEKNSSGVTVSGATFTWSSDTPGIATIDAAGVMHAVSAGTATFRAKAGDGTEATYSLQMVSNTFSTSADWSGNLEFGIPTGHAQAGDLLITHSQFTSSFNKGRNIPNWVSAKLDVSHYGTGSDRCDCFTYDPLVADSGGVRYTTDVYTGEGSVWNRGHLLRSADVESSAGDNSIAYLFTNIAPQSAQMNQGPWAQEENFLGDLAKTGGKDVYEIIGTSGVSATEAHLVKADVTIPAWFWKVAVIVPHGRKLADIQRDDDLQVIAVNMPNIAGVNSDWTTYKTTVDAIEALSGYDLLNALPDDIEAVVESNDQPPVARMTGPDAGSEGAALSFDGSTSSDPDAGDVLSYSWNFGDNTTATGVNPSHVFADNGQYIVTLTVSDQIGAKRSTTKVVTISNVAPTGYSASPGTVNEGDHYTLSITNVVDPSSADVAAGFSYRFDCGGGFGSWSPSSSTSCFANDNPGNAVAAEVKDKDGGTAHYDGTVVVNNVAPTAVFTNDGPVNEGGSFTLTLANGSDFSPVDLAAGFQYRFDCGSGFGDWGLSSSATCPAPNHGTFNVRGEIQDKDLGVSNYAGTVTVNNVAPTAVFAFSDAVNEGTPFTLSLSNGTDSPADVAAGLEYAFDCGSGFGAWSNTASVSCPTNDNGTPAVHGAIRDHDGAVSTYSGSVTVNNVAPTGAFATSAPVNEGSSFTLSITGAADASSADVTAGFTYRFDCGAGFGDWGSSSSAVCPAADNPGSESKGEIRDKDGATSSYAAFSGVNNVNPSVVVDAASPITSGGTFTLSGGFGDPGQADGPWTYVINWGDGNSTGSTNAQGAISGSHQYFVAGTYTVTLTVKDKDGGVGSASTTLQVGRVASSMSVNPNQISISNSGNGEISVTVFGNSQFGAGSITTGSIRIGSSAPDVQGNGSLQVSVTDVNRDGISDLVAKFQRAPLVSGGTITSSTTQLKLNATLTDGRQIQATGPVSVK